MNGIFDKVRFEGELIFYLSKLRYCVKALGSKRLAEMNAIRYNKNWQIISSSIISSKNVGVAVMAAHLKRESHSPVTFSYQIDSVGLGQLRRIEDTADSENPTFSRSPDLLNTHRTQHS